MKLRMTHYAILKCISVLQHEMDCGSLVLIQYFQMFRVEYSSKILQYCCRQKAGLTFSTWRLIGIKIAYIKYVKSSFWRVIQQKAQKKSNNIQLAKQRPLLENRDQALFFS